MPISFDLPMVPVTLPGDEEESWVDIDDELHSNKILFLCDELEDELANDIMSLMIFFNMEEDIRPLYLFINSPGGDVINGMAIDNVIQFTRSPVMTICLGIAASMASYILAGGSQKKRVALPHARIMIHQPFVQLEYEEEEESVDVLYTEFAELLILRETLARGYSERTGKPLWIISQDMERDIYMSAKEAQAYGIVDRVGI
uniref:ATP-dependent Clp protease proteolytic subunit n=2 Tax=Mammillaria TaxID=130139 RepID=A0A5J6VBI9_9CARY|nr:clp protease proteolytic subunit [Mammillaria pectinifera]QFG71562.1 clp protease proteolytic subunit [Mammillaria solisioides]